MTKLTRFELLLPSQLKDRLAKEAERDNRSMAAVIVVAVQKYLEGK